MKAFAGKAYDVTDFVSEGNINYLTGIVKDDPDQLEKTAHILSREEAEALPNDEFALILYHPQTGFLKKYAMTDRYLTKLNMKIFEDRKDNYPDEITKTAAYYMVKAAKHFKLPVSASMEKLAGGKHVSNVVDLTMINKAAWIKKQEMNKEAEVVEYALPSKSKYPIHTPEMVAKAVDYFEKHASKFEPLEAIDYAAHVKTAAIKYKIDTNDTMVEKYASLTSKSFSEDLRAHLMSRKGYVTEDQGQVYDELYQKSAEFGPIKTAECLEKVDRKLGAYRQWNRNIQDPYLSVLGIIKEASVKHKGKTIKQSMLSKAASEIVDADTLRDLMGPEGLDIFESLPVPIKDKIAGNL